MLALIDVIPKFVIQMLLPNENAVVKKASVILVRFVPSYLRPFQMVKWKVKEVKCGKQ